MPTQQALLNSLSISNSDLWGNSNFSHNLTNSSSNNSSSNNNSNSNNNNSNNSNKKKKKKNKNTNNGKQKNGNTSAPAFAESLEDHFNAFRAKNATAEEKKLKQKDEGNTEQKDNKVFAEGQDAWLAMLPDNMKLADFLASVGTDCKCLERFVYVPPFHFDITTQHNHRNKEVVYFSGDVHPEMMESLNIRKVGFCREIRSSNVLLLSVKGKGHLNLTEALEIAQNSDLKDCMHLVQVIAVAPKGPKKTKTSAHAYIKFISNEAAQQCVNIVDAFEFNGHYVHSPQLDAQDFFMDESDCHIRPFVWVNPSCRPSADLASSSASATSDVPAGGSTEEAETPPPELLESITPPASPLQLSDSFEDTFPVFMSQWETVEGEVF